MKRQIINVQIGKPLELNTIEIDGTKIKRVWTVYDENLLVQIEKNNSVIANIPLKHNHGVFLEDKVHDWFVSKDNVFRYYSRVVETATLTTVILELTE